MNQTTVNKSRLLNKIKENRESHVAEFEESYELWVQACKEYHVAQIKSLQEKNKENESLKRPLQPQSFSSEYDRVIGMLEMSVQDDVVLTAKEYDQYVTDKWGWTDSFKTLAGSYKGL